MQQPGRKPRSIAVRAVSHPTAAAAEAFARLLLAREQARPALTLVPTTPKRDKLARP